MARIRSKQNAAKEAPIVNRLKSRDFGWLNVDRYALATFSHAPVGIRTPGSDERQLAAVSGNALDHTASMAGPRRNCTYTS